MFAEVIVDVAHSETDKIFDYRFDVDGVKVGCRVEVPFGYQKKEGFVIGIKDHTDLPDNKVKDIIRLLDDFPAINDECLSLAKYVKSTYHVPFASALRLFIPAELRGGRVKEKTVGMLSLNDAFALEQMISSLRKGSDAQENAIKRLFELKTCRKSTMNEEFGASAIKSLLNKGYFVETTEKVGRVPYRELNAFNKNVKLTFEQENAVNKVLSTEKEVTLLFGVTGSGKTEVYLRLINETLKSGRTAIMLVPEIALTPQMLGQLRARFGDSVSILHSGLSAGERYDEWLKLKTGEAKIAIGARSAVFAPLENVGLIIVDEEHDSSYEAETSPRYKTIEIAIKRAELSGAKVVLGSATPSIESYDKALSGEYELAVMKNRINGKQLPEFVVADMRKEVRRGNASVFSADLRESRPLHRSLFRLWRLPMFCSA